MVVYKVFFLPFVSLTTVPIIKNSHILPEIFFIFPKEQLRPNSKLSQYQIWTSVERSKNKLSCKANFNTFSQNRYTNFRLKLC